ncbi:MULTISPECIES: energy transducer TonB [unclassified Mesorhizobium]|uniref:energy transducer TonB family protein n=1 Tax=unclassified Mesorhizobium TaxID=325217 RepID=UPI000BB0904E|nr:MULTISPECIES: energy transducer TonB [unclassified Mesorhizobium]PBB23711.1 energy transducer TonB [Mesorhizobium sp. WSM4304]PBB72556.1 energy transducer TonB [Mesorhizobium sp. WSM4308]
MTQAAALPTTYPTRFGWRDLGLWTGAAALVLGAHVAVAYAVQSFSPIEMDGGPPPAPVIEMVPMAVMPAVPEQAAMLEAAMPDQAEPAEEAERVAEAEPEKMTEQTEPTAEQPETVPPDGTEPTTTADAEPIDQPPPDQVVPEIVEAVTPEVVIALPQPKPVKKIKEKKPAQAKAKKPAEKPKPRPRKEKAEPARTVATASAQTRPAAGAAAPKSAAGVSGMDPAKWESRLASWINRHKRYPSAAKSKGAQGNVNVAFAVDASGRVVSARVARSSGDPDLDRAALAVLQGATVPAPPPGLGSRVSRTAPFVFNLRD